MSEELQGKLRSHQDAQTAKVFLAQIKDLEVISYNVTDKDFSRVQHSLEGTRKMLSSPSSTTPENNNVLPEAWLQSVLAQSKLNSPIYLRIADFYAAGWILATSQDLARSLSSIWQTLSVKDIEIADSQLSNILVLSEEEHRIEAFWKEIK
jgi:hypothetical protein